MIKIKIRENNKVLIRCNNPMEMQYFIEMMRSMRDGKYPHPQISLKNRDGDEIPSLPPPKPLIQIEKGNPVIASGIQVQMSNIPPPFVQTPIKKIDTSGV